MMDLVEQMRSIIERQAAEIDKLQKQVDAVAELVVEVEGVIAVGYVSSYRMRDMEIALARWKGGK